MDYSSIIEGTVKFRDGKKWKSRWCVMRKLSPVADCLHLQLYRDSKDRYKQGQTKASLSLQHFLGIESGFTLDKESNTIAILCQDVTVVLAFDTRERLIQWQVKIANNLGEDQQYLIQIASAPARTKISAGPARIHVREFRFSLTMGVPPRLIGVWDIRQLRRYGVVENRFCFEGGSSCGRLEGLYVFVTDQGEEITKTFKMASEGKLAVRRKPVSRNMSVFFGSVMESPRRTLQQRLMNYSEQGNATESLSGAHMKQNCDNTIWESTETTASCDYGDTASVGEAADAQECVGWAPDIGIGRCASCISKLGAMSRSSTVVQTPGTGFTPAWIMEEPAKCQQKEASTGCNASIISQISSSDSHGTSSSDTSSGCDCRSSVVSPCRLTCCCAQNARTAAPEHKPCCYCQAKPMSTAFASICHNTAGFVQQYENYDVPKTICAKLKDDKIIEETSRTSTQDISGPEYYDTPRKIKEHLSKQSVEEVHCSLPVQRHQFFCSAHQFTRMSCENVCSCQRLCQHCSQARVCCNVEHRLSTCEETLQVTNYTNNGAVYARVDLLKKTKKNTEKSEVNKCLAQSETNPSHKEVTNQINYENLEFAQSLEHYENVKDLMVRLQDSLSNGKGAVCLKCSCGQANVPLNRDNKSSDQDDYLIMGPICDNENREEITKMRTSVLSYLPMNPISTKYSPTKCNACCNKNTERDSVLKEPAPPNEISRNGPDFDQSKSACASPFLRRHNDSSCYSSIDGRRLAAIRRRSNSVDSGRYYEGLDCISERTTSSTHNTITANSATASIDSLPSEKTDNKEPLKEEATSSKVIKTTFVQAYPSENQELNIARRLPHVPCKSAVNRDSSSSNDSGVSTGSLKHCGAEFMEFETLITPLSKVRHHSLSNREICLTPPRRSKSSDPLQDLSFQFDKTIVAPKSSSAEAEVPVTLIKKEITKEFSVSSSSGGLTIPYMDSISTSSGTSDMSDYIDTLSMSSYSSSDADNLRLSHTAATVLRPRSGKEYQKIDRYNIDDVTGKNSHKPSVPQNSDSPSLGYISSTSSN